MSSFWENMAILGQVCFMYICLCITIMWAYMVFIVIKHILITIKNNINE